MEAMRQSWTDERLDDFRADVGRRFDKFGADGDRRFDAVDRRFDHVEKRFDKVDARFDRMDDRLDSMGRIMIFGFIAMTSAMLAGFGGIAAVLATRG
jgi:hypothetical protein